ncbi:MAG: hypothetical protein KAS32_16515, partial [Candidatus Peribacteraceae bacterium]|nr:hypothetical protein [Candidatus Peribacteraceae bacterium]
MSFTLRDAEHSVDVVLSDLRSRMLSATSSEYEMYAKMYLAMMSIFGGNWSGYENVSDTTNFNDNRIFQGDPKYLGESIEAEVIDGNNGGQ